MYIRLCGPCSLCCNYSALTWYCESTIDTMETSGPGYVPIKLYLEKQAVDQIWPLGYSLLTFGLRFCLYLIDFAVWSSTPVLSDLKQNKTHTNSKSRVE